jgi:protoheme IX farnesyltransferase
MASISLLVSKQRSRLADFVTLTKPGVMMLAVFTAIVGLIIAPGDLAPIRACIAVFAIAAGAGAAGVLNMWYDADIDAVMTRTARRPIPSGRIGQGEALAFGLVLAGGSVVALALAANLVAAGLLAFTILFYIVIYTAWLKRRTPHNIVIGGAAGALPPVIGWAAVTGDIGLEPLVLFLIVFLWTPPHFWALALNRGDDYARAGVPMLPVVAGRTATKRQILLYSLLLVPVSLLPCVLGFAGALYGAISAIWGALFIAIALRLSRTREGDAPVAQRLFVFSIAYLFLLFAALLAGHGGGRAPVDLSSASTHAGVATAGRAIAYATPRRLDRGPQARVERPSLHDRPLIAERRSLRSALRAPVETTGITISDCPAAAGEG